MRRRFGDGEVESGESWIGASDGANEEIEKGD